MPKKETEVRSTRDFYILKFEDEDYKVSWRTGNLRRFLRNLFTDNKVLRDAWPKLNAIQFAVKMANNITYNLRSHKIKNNVNACPFYLLPYSHVSRFYYMGMIERRSPERLKAFQD